MPVYLVTLRRKYPRTRRSTTVTRVANAESPAQTRFDSKDYTVKGINAPPCRTPPIGTPKAGSGDTLAVPSNTARCCHGQFADAEDARTEIASASIRFNGDEGAQLCSDASC